MGENVLVESSNFIEVLNSVTYVLDHYTMNKTAPVISLVATGCSLEQLAGIYRFSIKNHFEISGIYSLNSHWRDDLVSLISGNHVEVFLNLDYQWGSYEIFISIKESGRYSDSIMVDVNVRHESIESSNELTNFKQNAHQFFNILGINIDETMGDFVSDKLRITSRFFGQTNQIHLFIKKIDTHLKQRIIETFFNNVSTPNQCHISLMTDFDTVKNLFIRKTIESCINCCDWHLSYGKIALDVTNIKEDQLELLAEYLANEKLRDRFISFGRFRWNWEKNLDGIPYGNILTWLLTRKNVAKLKMQWYDALPRGQVQLIRKDLTSKFPSLE